MGGDTLVSRGSRREGGSIRKVRARGREVREVVVCVCVYRLVWLCVLLVRTPTLVSQTHSPFLALSAASHTTLRERLKGKGQEDN